MQSSLILGAISCFAPIFFGPHLANASLAGDHVSVTRSSGSIVVHSPTEAEVTDISTNPQLTFKPLGDLNTIVAFARLQASIDLGEIADACDVATSAMKTIWTLAPPDSYAHQYASDTPMVVEVFMDTRQELQDACNNLDNWDAPDNFFTERSYPHRRSPNEPLPTPDLDHARNAAFLFGTVEPEMRPTPNGTAADPDDRIARADPITIASVVIGGSMLLLTLFQMLFGGSTPTWSMDAATQHIANGARSSANALAQLCEKITKVWHFDEFMNYVNGARDNAKDLIGLINDIRRAIFQLLLGNISPVFLTSLNIQAALDALSSEAAAHHLRLAVRSAADVIQMPAFGIRADRTLKIVVPIPVASDTLAAHEFAGTPLLAGSADNGFSLITPQPPYTCIAVDGSSSNHILFNPGDLSRCFKVHKTYMCPEFPVRTNRQASCLGSLFTANTGSVKEQCMFGQYRESWHMARASRGEFIFATSVPTSATTSCPQGHSKSVALNPGVFRLTVPPGCTTMTPDVSVTAAYTDFAQVDIHKSLQWTPASYADYKRNYSAFSDLQQHAAHAAADIQRGINMASAAHRTPWWQHAAWGLALLAAIAGVIGFVVCRFRGVAGTIASITSALTADTRPLIRDPPEPVVEYRAAPPTLPGQAVITFAAPTLSPPKAPPLLTAN